MPGGCGAAGANSPEGAGVAGGGSGEVGDIGLIGATGTGLTTGTGGGGGGGGGGASGAATPSTLAGPSEPDTGPSFWVFLQATPLMANAKATNKLKPYPNNRDISDSPFAHTRFHTGAFQFGIQNNQR